MNEVRAYNSRDITCITYDTQDHTAWDDFFLSRCSPDQGRRPRRKCHRLGLFSEPMLSLTRRPARRNGPFGMVSSGYFRRRISRGLRSLSGLRRQAYNFARGCACAPANFFRRGHPYARKSASHAVLSRMQLTLHATRQTTSQRFALGASNVCLVGENPTCAVPAVGMRGPMVIRLRP